MKIHICKLVRPAECSLRIPIMADELINFENGQCKVPDSPDALCGINHAFSFKARFEGRHDYIKYEEVVACQCKDVIEWPQKNFTIVEPVPPTPAGAQQPPCFDCLFWGNEWQKECAGCKAPDWLNYSAKKIKEKVCINCKHYNKLSICCECKSSSHWEEMI